MLNAHNNKNLKIKNMFTKTVKEVPKKTVSDKKASVSTAAPIEKDKKDFDNLEMYSPNKNKVNVLQFVSSYNIHYPKVLKKKKILEKLFSRKNNFEQKLL